MIKKTLYQSIGLEFISQAIGEFYVRAFRDPIISHFFFHHDRQDLTQKQITFAAAMLGAREITYKGKPLLQAHARLPLTAVHFNRRQVLMAEVLADLGLDPRLQEQWLALEERLRPLIVNTKGRCNE